LLTQLRFLIKKAVAVRKHLERNRKDRDAKFRLMYVPLAGLNSLSSSADICEINSLIESRIHRLARYYKTSGVIAPTWRYESSTASTLVA
jgi:small subunit ribosomal protein S13e